MVQASPLNPIMEIVDQGKHSLRVRLDHGRARDAKRIRPNRRVYQNGRDRSASDEDNPEKQRSLPAVEHTISMAGSTENSGLTPTALSQFPRAFRTPFPPPHLRQILAVFVDVLLVLDQLVLELLLQVDAWIARLRQAVNGVHH